MSFSSARRSSSLSPSTHLCPPEDIFHSWVPRLCQLCSSRLPGWDGRAAHARSPWTQMLYESTDPAQLEAQHLTEETTILYLGKRIPAWNENSTSFKWVVKRKTKETLHTHRHICFGPTPNQPCRNIWSCPVCSDSLHSDRHPAWSTHWCLQGWWKKQKQS